MKAIFFGIVQGLTEFLPVSSSGHLYILKKYLYISHDLFPYFVFLHLSTLLAICIYLRKDIILLLKNKNVLLQVGIITVITVIIALIVNKFLFEYFENKYCISAFLLINSGILLCSMNASERRNKSGLRLSDSIILGFLQGLAVFPGISRSGITIVGLLKRGFKKKEAFSLSFLMAIPVILAAFSLNANKLADLNLSISNMLLGFVAAFIFGILALMLVKKALITERFDKFGYYCIIISALNIIL